MVPSESRGVALPFQLGNSTGSGATGFTITSKILSGAGAYSNIGDAKFSSYTQGTGVTTDCESASSNSGHPLYYLNATSQYAHVATQVGTGVNASGEAINNVVREARALSNGTTTDYYGNIALGPNMWPFIQ